MNAYLTSTTSTSNARFASNWLSSIICWTPSAICRREPSISNARSLTMAFDMEGSRRHIALGVQQMIELGQLLANRALDVVEVR